MRTRLLAATLTAAAALTLTACSSGSGSAASAPSTATPASPGPSAPAASPAADTPGATSAPPSAPAPADPTAPPATAKPSPPADAGLPPKPDSALIAKLVGALDAIDRDIVAGEPDKAAERARSTCQDIYRYPKDKDKLVDLTNQRFTSPKHPSGLGPEQAAKIVEAVRSTFCPAS
ncbi:hypothetical protein OG689_10300 [Kitasatospora sp. NBC_00240]|uniref:DUF732 domain-containing protein n=1 Tax=Kitasatospora sp. NBC_00240 TaxID=2903567 RepID=UPI0022549BD1|nr:DUF732 domain-containing protein [Kitasatospora sp. NBC_00240]MCX5209674.1 hypothetical protein [Kitasatospora sp. NBC_00240]